jgi:hypothetical protein
VPFCSRHVCWLTTVFIIMSIFPSVLLSNMCLQLWAQVKTRKVFQHYSSFVPGIFSVTWLLAEVWDCWGLLSIYLLGDWHGYPGHGWTINYFYSCPDVYDHTTQELMPLLFYPNYLSSIQEQRGLPRQTLFNLHSARQSAFHSSWAFQSWGLQSPKPRAHKWFRE